jgi:hypothetical protein
MAHWFDRSYEIVPGDGRWIDELIGEQLAQEVLLTVD